MVTTVLKCGLSSRPASLQLTTVPWPLCCHSVHRFSLLASFSERFRFLKNVLFCFSNKGENGYNSKMGDVKPFEVP